MIVKKRMENIFKSLGIEMQVHNIAQGANNCIPYTFCYESMGGLDPDFVGWEQVSRNINHWQATSLLISLYFHYSLIIAGEMTLFLN